jgi:hypothetical protein
MTRSSSQLAHSVAGTMKDSKQFASCARVSLWRARQLLLAQLR